MDDVGLNNKRQENGLHSNLGQLKFDKKNYVFSTSQNDLLNNIRLMVLQSTGI